MTDRMRTTMTIAAIAIGACLLATLVYFVGWMPSTRTPVAVVPPEASKPPQTVTMQSGVALLPGETLVAPPDSVAPAAAPAARPASPGPSPPRYSKPAPPPPAAPRTPPPAVAQQAPRPSPPQQYSREDRRSSAYERSARSVCPNCGVVTAITRGDYDWEVRVRFDDGGREIHRYYDRPRIQVGDAVRLEGGQLLPD